MIDVQDIYDEFNGGVRDPYAICAFLDFVQTDPLQSREHILLANLLDKSWRDGRNLQMADLIRGLQSPPFDKVGFVDLETFFPARERMELSLQLNNLLAAPGFEARVPGPVF